MTITTKEYITMTTNNALEHLPAEMQAQVREYNKALCDKYSWVIPRNVWSGRKITECSNILGNQEGYWPGKPEMHPEYNYEYTNLDDIPEGWRLAFGDQLAEDIQAEIDKAKTTDPEAAEKIWPTQIKEKYGTLRMYFTYETLGLSDTLRDYERLSAITCECCGEPATQTTTGWITHLCDKCYDSATKNYGKC